jgi:hypothetical protein
MPRSRSFDAEVQAQIRARVRARQIARAERARPVWPAGDDFICPRCGCYADGDGCWAGCVVVELVASL